MSLTELIRSRTSVAKLVAPAPDKATLDEAFACALRAPDHRVLRPWRYLVIHQAQLSALGDLFVEASRQHNAALEEQEIEKLKKMPLRAPMVVVAITAYKDDPKVPRDEQTLSTGASVQNFLLALQAKGFASMWRTGPMADNAVVMAGLGLQAHEKIAGFLYVGSPNGDIRQHNAPVVEDFVSTWSV